MYSPPRNLFFPPFPFPLFLSFFLVCVFSPSLLTHTHTHTRTHTHPFLEKFDPVVFCFLNRQKNQLPNTHTHTHIQKTLETLVLYTSTHFHNNSSRRNHLPLLLLHLVVVKINIFCVFDVSLIRLNPDMME